MQPLSENQGDDDQYGQQGESEDGYTVEFDVLVDETEVEVSLDELTSEGVDLNELGLGQDVA